MRIAYIALRGIPLSDGIVEYTDNIARQMVKKGHEVFVYTSRRYGNKTGLYDNSYHIITVPSIPFKFAEKMSLVFFASIHQLFQKYDIVHYHAMGPSIFAFIAKIEGKTTIIQSHGIEYNRVKFNNTTRKVLKILEKWSINMGDELLVCSNALHEHFLNNYGKETVVIHNAVRIPEIIPCNSQVLEKYKLEQNEYFLFMARITREKGLHYLINSFKKLNTRKKLVIAGPYDKNDKYHQEVLRLALNDERINFVGFITGAEKEALLRGSLAFCLPSESEGFSVALLEAMSYGKCCIISDIPSNLEAAAESCIPFESKNEKDLFQALEKVESNPKFAHYLGLEARKRAEKYFSEDILSDKTERLYKDLINRKIKKKECERDDKNKVFK